VDKKRKGMFITGFIDVELWNKATWKAVAVMSNMSTPPYLGLVFQNEKAAKEIFEGWRERFGTKDEYEELRVSIIEGDIPGDDPGYTVHINSNVKNIMKRAEAEKREVPADMIMTIGRFHRMNPDPSSKNLEMFKSEYSRTGAYYLIPCVISKDLTQIKPIMNLAIEKNDVIFRNSKEIKKHDLDYVVFKKN
jgi:hypothetical protein